MGNLMVKAPTIGSMAIDISVSGKITKKLVKESLLPLME
jgi:hypothetical protein